MSDDNGSDYDVPELPPMLPELDDLPPLTSLNPSTFSASQAIGDGSANAAGNADGMGDGADGAAAPDGATPAKPKKIRKPVPKLDATRLCSKERGLPHLVQDFKTIRFKGRGHEASDIRLLMRRYEHWAHRLFPKYPLRTSTEIIELSLASKREVKVCMAQLRRGDDGDDALDVDVLEPEPVRPVLPLL
ncbi:TIMELESS-interacting protein-like [Sycon ciliatum]|uniref:TIMELESS-interacting protein-like n=1 Tax=Sycon ciliatum TaxID=27933 RepID=UPI0031F68870